MKRPILFATALLTTCSVTPSARATSSLPWISRGLRREPRRRDAAWPGRWSCRAKFSAPWKADLSCRSGRSRGNALTYCARA